MIDNKTDLAIKYADACKENAALKKQLAKSGGSGTIQSDPKLFDNTLKGCKCLFKNDRSVLMNALIAFKQDYLDEIKMMKGLKKEGVYLGSDEGIKYHEASIKKIDKLKDDINKTDLCEG